MKFFKWYYTDGLRELLSIWQNFLAFIGYYFSIKRLFLTLFSPWRRDVLADDWVGFHPLLWMQNFVLNSIFRFFGACCRFVVIVMGLILQIVFVAVGLLILLIWILFPVVIALFISSAFWKIEMFLLILAVIIVFCAIVFNSYIKSNRKTYGQMSISELAKQKWFERVIARSDLEQENLVDFDWEDQVALKKILKKHNLTLAEFERIIGWEIILQKENENKNKFWRRENLFSTKPIGLYWRYGYTRYLNQYAVELTKYDYSSYGSSKLFGYENEIALVKLSLARNDQNNILLYGDPGVGKKSIVHHIAKEIRTGKTNNFLQDKRIFLISLGEVVSSLVDKGGNVEHAIHSIFKEAALAGDIILAIDQVGRYLGTAEKNSSVNMNAIVGEYLRLPSFRMIATISRGSYQRLTKEGEAILKDFEVSEVKEPKEEEVYRILLQKIERNERKKVIFTFQALREILNQSDRVGNSSPLPERAIDLMTEVLLNSKKNGINKITPEEVSSFITIKTGVKHGKVGKKEKDDLLNLEKILHESVIGQDIAIDQIADSIRKMRAGVGDKNKPVGSFLFLGSTGVGKTETAKALARSYFGSEKNMIRIDMSEFQSPNSISKMIGQTEFKKSGFLTSKVEQKPFSLILLDEIEKAYPEILNLFLQVLDEGFLTDAFGKKINFRNSIIIATSNAGADFLKKKIQENVPDDEIKNQLIDHIVDKNIFKVEFLNRFDDVIFFKILSREQIHQVTVLMLNEFSKKIDSEKNIKLKYDKGVIDKIIDNGYDKIFGARSIKRYIADNIQNIIAEKIISEEIVNGSEMVIKIEDLK